MENNSALPNSNLLSDSYIDNQTFLPKKTSIAYAVGSFFSAARVLLKTRTIALAIFLGELTRFPKNTAKLGFKAALSGGSQRYKQATDFCIGGENLLAKVLFNSHHAREVQLQLLQKILQTNAATQFGKDHQFGKIETLEQFRQWVTINTYESLEPYIQRHLDGEKDVLVMGKPCYYATTSGSTGRPKFIPVTPTMEKEAHQGSARLWSYTLYKNEPLAYSGKIIVIVSPAIEGYTDAGVPYGSISGQYIKNLNENIRAKYAIPYELYEIKDYEARYYCMLLLGLADDGVTMLSSTNPSTLSLIAEKGNQYREALIRDIRRGKLDEKYTIDPEIRAQVETLLVPNPQRADYLQSCIEQDPEGILRPLHYWKKLVVIACWTGGNSQVFLNRMKRWYGDVKIKDLGYLASEIRGSVPMNINTSEGILTIDENFFEFLEDGESEFSSNYLLVDQLQVGKRYRLYFTNRAGLYRYDINDIVEVKGFVNGVPTIDFVQKGKGVTNITGEKIYEQQVLDVVAKAAALHDLKIAYYQLQARMELSRYDFFCEIEGDGHAEQQLIEFLADLDSLMKKTNLEYKTKRDSMRLHPMQLNLLGKNSFEAFRKWRVANGVREAQIKNVPLSADMSLVSPLTVEKTLVIQ